MKSLFDETLDDLLQTVRAPTKIAEQRFNSSLDNRYALKKLAQLLENQKPSELTFELLYAVKSAGTESQLKSHKNVNAVSTDNMFKKIAFALEHQIVSEHNQNVKKASLVLKALPGLALLKKRMP
jgi:hypothetical protein